MRGVGQQMTLGERIGYYRVRRDMSQRALAEMVGRTENWLQKVETGRILLDRLSVIRALADVLDVGLADLLGEPSLLNWSADSGQQTVTAIRTALTDYRQLVPFDTDDTRATGDAAAVNLDALDREVLHLWDLYQGSRYGALAKRLPYAISVRAFFLGCGVQTRSRESSLRREVDQFAPPGLRRTSGVNAGRAALDAIARPSHDDVRPAASDPPA